jgi:hypothetical protein
MLKCFLSNSLPEPESDDMPSSVLPTKSAPHWVDLPPPVLISIQQCFSEIFQAVFIFLSDSRVCQNFTPQTIHPHFVPMLIIHSAVFGLESRMTKNL